MTTFRWASVAAGLILFGGTASAQPPSTTALAIDIPAAPLNDAIKQLARQAGFQVVFYSKESDGLQAPKLSGTFTPAAALAQLLAGTGLTYEFVDGNTIAIRPKPVQTGASETGDAAPVLEEIVVTAQKRKERLLDVPQAVSVLAADSLAKQGALQFRDYADTVPGLSFLSLGAGYTQLSLRGVSAGQDITPTVAVYVDEVPYGSSTAFAGGTFTAIDVALFDLDRIEVLRGPQGTLYGASAVGGLIKYVTRQPNTTDFAAEAQASLSSTRDGGTGYSAAAAVNIPIVTDKVALRASGFESHDGGYIDNLALGREDVNRSDVYGGRLDLLLVPTEALTVRITGFMQNVARDGMTQADYSFAGAPLYGELAQRHLSAEPFENRFRLGSATVAWDFGPATLTSISSYQTVDTEIASDFTGLYVPLLATVNRFYSSVSSVLALRTEKFTQEARLASNGSGTFQWVIGAFYTDEKSSSRGELALRDPAGQPAPNDVLTSVFPTRFEEYAAFGDLTWRLTDRLDVTGGLRYARNDQELQQIGSGLLGASRPFRRSNDDVVTYLANARYRVGDRATTYMRYATGYRAGGPNAVLNNPVTGLPVGPDTFESDNLRSYEIGFKAETASRALGFDLATYFIDWSNIQIVGQREGINVRANAPGGANIRGAELTLTARPVAGLSMTSSLVYLDSYMAKADPDLRARKGERLPNSARFTAALTADYTFAGERMQPTLGATLRHISDRTAGFDNGAGTLRQYVMPEYDVVDLRGGLAFDAVDVQLFIRNVFDKRAQQSAMTPFGTALIGLSQPRTIGVTATARFP